jgi:hypothetical protein
VFEIIACNEDEAIEVGQIFIVDGGYTELLAQVGPNKVSLIELFNGNRWRDAVKVENIYNISIEEMEKIVGNYFYIRSGKFR